MIGPSAPNGPPVPIAIAAEIGFKIATLGSMRLRLISTASMASGMPCPLILAVPYLAMKPTITPPITGIRITQGSKLVMSRAGEFGNEAMIENNICEQANKLVEQKGNAAGNQPNGGSKERDQHHAE